MTLPQSDPRPARVGIVYPRATLDSVPALCQAAELLAAAGYPVDLFVCERPGTTPATFSSARVSQQVLGPEPGSAPGSILSRLMARFPLVGSRPQAGSLYAQAAQLPGFNRAASVVQARHAGQAPYACLVGVDPDGLDLAEQLARPAGIPLAYYSLELMPTEEISPVDPAARALKERERALSRSAAFTVIQDSERARLLMDDNGIDSERLVLVPNAPLGPARRSRSAFWQERFGLPERSRVALHSGSLGDWTGIEDIVASVPSWPAEWILVIHTRNDAESSRYVDRLRAAADPSRVRFSLKPVPRERYDELVDGADAGIAFYVPAGDSSFTGSNVRTIGLSSGKLAYYVRAGLPVVVNRASTLGELVAREGFGLSVASAAEIGEALSQVEADYDRYSARARAFFDEQLDFARAFAEVIRRVDQLSGKSSDSSTPAFTARLEPVTT